MVWENRGRNSRYSGNTMVGMSITSAVVLWAFLRSLGQMANIGSCLFLVRDMKAAINAIMLGRLSGSGISEDSEEIPSA